MQYKNASVLVMQVVLSNDSEKQQTQFIDTLTAKSHN